MSARLLGIVTASLLVAGSARAQTKVACAGDSITSGVGASSAAMSYPGQLQRLLGASHAVHNAGYSGATLMQAGDTPYGSTAAFTSSTSWVASGGDVVLQLGTNDSKPKNWSKNAGFLADCKALVAHYRAGSAATRVWVSLPPPALGNACCNVDGTVVANEIVPLLRTCATDTGASVIDVFTALSPHAAHFPDGVHPNDAGAALIAQTVRDALMKQPRVSLTASPDNTVAPASIVLAATPTAAYGTVENVTFYEGAAQLAEATAAPWTATISNVPEGPHAYMAKVTETAGRTSTSAVVTVTVLPGSAPPGGGGGGGGAEERADAAALPPGSKVAPGGAGGSNGGSDAASSPAPESSSSCTVVMRPQSSAASTLAALALVAVARRRRSPARR